MRIRMALVLIPALLAWAVPWLDGQSPNETSFARTWSLPQAAAVKDGGPRTYRFTVDYNGANAKGEVVYRQHVVGEYTRGLPNREVAWKNVSVATAMGPSATFPDAQKREFIEGFRYPNDMGGTLKPGFFKGFPPTAVAERNLVWDTAMIETYGQNYFDHLQLNQPYRTGGPNEDVTMPDVGTFHSRGVVLEWIGASQRNGQDCAIIQYQSFFNPIEIANGGMTLNGRSDYWGEIWVSLATKQIEYATLHEIVVGEMKLPGQDTTQVMNVFRTGTLEPFISN